MVCRDETGYGVFPVEALCGGLRFLLRLESMRHGGNHPISKHAAPSDLKA